MERVSANDVQKGGGLLPSVEVSGQVAERRRRLDALHLCLVCIALRLDQAEFGTVAESS